MLVNPTVITNKNVEIHSNLGLDFLRLPFKAEGYLQHFVDMQHHKPLDLTENTHTYPGGSTQRMFEPRGRCGWGAETVTLFQTEISDFPTLSPTLHLDF